MRVLGEVPQLEGRKVEWLSFLIQLGVTINMFLIVILALNWAAGSLNWATGHLQVAYGLTEKEAVAVAFSVFLVIVFESVQTLMLTLIWLRDWRDRS